MRVIIIGGGQVGTELADRLSREQDVVVIEKNAAMAQRIEAAMDLMVINGNGASVQVLEKAGIREAKLLIAVTEIDEVNIIACMLAKNYGVETTVARIRNTEYEEGSRVLTNEQLGIDIIINPERVAAQEIAKMIKSPNISEVEHYADGRVLIIGYYIKEDSPSLNKKVSDIRFPEGCIVCAILRESGEIVIPSGEDVIFLNDEIYILGKTEVFSHPWFNHIAPSYPRKVVIAGGGKVGLQLAEMLEAEGNKFMVKLIERDSSRGEEIANLLNKTLVLQGDVTDIHFLKAEEIGKADVLVAVTGDDEINLLSTLLADHLGVKVTISEVIRSDYNIIHNSIGIDRMVSPRLLTAAQIIKLIRKGDVISMTILKEDKAEVMELFVSERALIANKKLMEVNLPRGILVAGLVRDKEIIIPGGEDFIFAGDRVIVFYLTELSPEVDKFFTHTEKGPTENIGQMFRNIIRGK